MKLDKLNLDGKKDTIDAEIQNIITLSKLYIVSKVKSDCDVFIKTLLIFSCIPAPM